MNGYEALVRAIQNNGGVECEQSPDAFFIETGDENTRFKVSVARKICSDCPVRLLCLDYALQAGEDQGIWGGLTANERRTIQRGGRVA